MNNFNSADRYVQQDRDLLFEDEIRGRTGDESRPKGNRFAKSKGGEGGRELNLRIRRLVKNSKGLPEAVVKVSSWTKNSGKAIAHAKYVARAGKKDGDLPFELEDGSVLTKPEEAVDLLKTWETDKHQRKDARFTANIVLSSPEGTDPDKVRRAVRGFASDFFGNHEFMFVVHEDTKNHHAHLTVKAAGFDGKQLRLGKAELKMAREHYATHLLAQGVEVNASYRSDRGHWEKSKPQSKHHLEQEGRADPRKVAEIKQTHPEQETKEEGGNKYIDIKAEYLGAARYLRSTDETQSVLDADSLEKFAESIKPSIGPDRSIQPGANKPAAGPDLGIER
ncbi:MAG: relaxase/mobilization nuclease domain-containing protein [Gammaproteobacteria bacterium]|nr:relaxase/mobilization nuclease domain-containing protein [Gammaproteobacteria bacterium]MBL4729745.1 relaxase/mobilization nuclease domain-containing protein [Gammaproteobacteria bacterium]